MLVRRYGPRIRRWIACRIHDRAEVEDLTQEVLLSAWRAGPRLRPDTVLPAWLKTIALNACRKRARRCLRKPAVPSGLAPPGAPSHDPPDVAESLDVASALRRLPRREERVLRLLYHDEFSIRQTAAVLDVSSDAAKSLAARARRRFRSQFGGWFGQVGGLVVLPFREGRELWEGLGSWMRSAAAGTAAAAAASLAVTVGGSPQPTPPPTPPAPSSVAAAPETTAPRGIQEGTDSDAALAADALDASEGDEAPAGPLAAETPGAPDEPDAAGDQAGSAASSGDDPGAPVGAVGTADEECAEDKDTEDAEDAESTDCDDPDPTEPPTSPGPAPGPAPEDPAAIKAPPATDHLR